MPKQVGLIIPRGPFLNLEWFVGLLKGDNWIHRAGRWHAHTVSSWVRVLALWHRFPSWDLHVQIPMPMHNATQVAAVKRPRPSWDRQLSHASFSASTASSHIPLREPLECACEFACLHVSVSNYLSGSWKEMRRVRWTANFSRRVSRTVLHACTRTCKGVLLRIYQSSSKLWESQHGCGASPGPLTNRVQPFWLGECQQVQALSKIHSNCDSPNTIPAMQMQTCIIFAQIPLRATILTTVHSH